MSAKKERDLTATLHLGPRTVAAGSPSNEPPENLDMISKEDRQIVEKLAPEDAMLIVHRGPSKGSRFLVTKSGVTIGRSPESEVFLDDVTVSRKHAEIFAASSGPFQPCFARRPMW